MDILHIIGWIFAIFAGGVIILSFVALICDEIKIQNNRKRLSDKLGVDKDDVFWGD